ncbi:peptidoglycan amidohydrolase family protein [Enterococcus ratti]|uniref:peptidoglycan amidohydrolase family protein n=1 Tax=Enterococcus ratti TaxID=150033 RepID=UPI0035116D78
MKKHNLLEERTEIIKRNFFQNIKNIHVKAMSTGKKFFSERKIKDQSKLKVYKDKGYFFKRGVICGGFFLFLLTVGVVIIFFSIIPKNDEFELTKIWTYFTNLDAEKNLTLRQHHKHIKINGKTVINQQFNLATNIDEILAYLDVRYEEFELENPNIKKKLHEIHDNMWRLYANKKGHLSTQSFIQSVDWTREWKERLSALLTIGPYQHLFELKSPFSKDNQIKVNQRYGYFLEKQAKKMFNGIQIQVEKDKEILASMTGEATVSDNSIIIQSKDRQLVIKNIRPTIANRQKVVTGELIGTVAKENQLVIEYIKKNQSLNPGFYFKEVEYLQTFSLESENSRPVFDESTFRKLILFNCHAFSDKADKILIEAQKNGISPVIFAAIMIHESAWGTSKGIIEKNNPAGLMAEQGLITYNTLDEGIEATGRTLKNLIIKQQLLTIEKLGTYYCPVDAENDPMGFNHYWVSIIKQLIVQLGGSPNNSLLWENPSDLHEEILIKAQSIYQKGVQYSQGPQRGNFPYHDCSSFVIWAMNEAGMNVPYGNTETLYQLEGTFLQSISRTEVRAGDLFIWGEKGNSSGNYGHTGFFLDDEGKTIIHCTPATKKGFGQNGDIVVTSFDGYYGDSHLAPVYFYRILGRKKP